MCRARRSQTTMTLVCRARRTTWKLIETVTAVSRARRRRHIDADWSEASDEQGSSPTGRPDYSGDRVFGWRRATMRRRDPSTGASVDWGVFDASGNGSVRGGVLRACVLSRRSHGFPWFSGAGPSRAWLKAGPRAIGSGRFANRRGRRAHACLVCWSRAQGVRGIERVRCAQGVHRSCAGRAAETERVHCAQGVQ